MFQIARGRPADGAARKRINERDLSRMCTPIGKDRIAPPALGSQHTPGPERPAGQSINHFACLHEIELAAPASTRARTNQAAGGRPQARRRTRRPARNMRIEFNHILHVVFNNGRKTKKSSRQTEPMVLRRRRRARFKWRTRGNLAADANSARFVAGHPLQAARVAAPPNRLPRAVRLRRPKSGGLRKSSR
jgi:hypothetical protein